MRWIEEKTESPQMRAFVPNMCTDMPARLGRWLLLSSIVFSFGLLADGFAHVYRALSDAPPGGAAEVTVSPSRVSPIGSVSG